ncbi:MAG: YihY/virulence factor BrkB family protein [Clostridia bacterium]|nr:YihY/virulence factor BrkB family protein [Clostridia bacterium]
MLGFFNGVKHFNEFKRSKRSATLAGALVFFTVLGLVPTAYLLSLVLALFGNDLSIITKVFSISEFDEVKTFIIGATSKLSAGGNAIAGIIAIYSSANLFVHLKLTGEFIYNCKASGGLFLRVFSIIGTVIISLVVAFCLVLYAFLSVHIYGLLGKILGSIVNVIALFFISLVAVICINLFTCPYKIRIKEVFKGSFYTCVFSVIFTFVFILYVKFFATYGEIYGKISVIPVFFGWLFIIMRCLVDGFVINAYQIGRLKHLKKIDLKTQL